MSRNYSRNGLWFSSRSPWFYYPELKQHVQLTASIFSVRILLVLYKIKKIQRLVNSLENRDENLSGVCITNNKKLSKSVFHTNDINPEKAESETREKADAFFDGY